jgi:hypothetical protein
MGDDLQSNNVYKPLLTIQGVSATPDFVPVSASRRLTVCGQAAHAAVLDKLALVFTLTGESPGRQQQF